MPAAGSWRGVNSNTLPRVRGIRPAQASRGDPNRLIIVDDGAVVVALLRVGQAAIVEIGRLRRFELDRLALIGDRLSVAAELLVGRAAIGVAAVAAGIELDRLVTVLDRVRNPY